MMASHIEKRSPAAPPPFAVPRDLWLLLELPVLATIAALVPERRWRRVCLALERGKARLGIFSPAPILAGLRQRDGAATVDDAFAVAATRSEHHLQILRELLRPGRLAVELDGAARLAAALAEGRGAVLWVAHFSFNAIAAKKAVHEAGLPLVHLSRPEHGFSKSRLGIALFNPLRVRAERRYLAGRIVIDRAHPGAALVAARRALAANRLVSITAGAWEGLQVARVPMQGGTWTLATGAPGLALLAGAPLLPVIAVREDGASRISVRVGPALRFDRGAPRDEAVRQAAEAFAGHVAPQVARHAAQWRDWEKLAPPAL